MLAVDHSMGSCRPTWSPSTIHTQSHLHIVNQLKDDMRRQLKHSFSDSGLRLGDASHENKLKDRAVYLDNLNRNLDVILPKTRSISLTLRKRIGDLQRQNGSLQASLAVCEKRIELRSQRPRAELFQDKFDESLSNEECLSLAAQEDILTAIRAGHSLTQPLETAVHKMQAARLTLTTDRTGATESLLRTSSTLLHSAEQYCQDADNLLHSVRREMEEAGGNSLASMRRQIAETYDLRTHIGDEKDDTKSIIIEAEQQLDRLKRQLKLALSMPERSLDLGGDGQNEKLSAKTGVLSTLRSKIKGAAYTGLGGRDFMTTFQRFDRDHSGDLDEDEIRIALRRACKIPPSAVTDVEICALCELLDEDNSGKVSIAELVDFILADMVPAELQKQIQSLESTLAILKAAQEETICDFKSKTRVWRINEACSKVTQIKSLELDKFPSMSRQRTNTSAAMRHRSAIAATDKAKRKKCVKSHSSGAAHGGIGGPRNPGRLVSEPLACREDVTYLGDLHESWLDAETSTQGQAAMQLPQAWADHSIRSDVGLQSSISSQSSRRSPSGRARSFTWLNESQSSSLVGAGPTPKIPELFSREDKTLRYHRSPSDLSRNLLLT